MAPALMARKTSQPSRGLTDAGTAFIGAPFRTTCCRSSVVERILGKAEVVSSILTGSTISTHSQAGGLASMEIAPSQSGGLASKEIAR